MHRALSGLNVVQRCPEGLWGSRAMQVLAAQVLLKRSSRVHTHTASLLQPISSISADLAVIKQRGRAFHASARSLAQRDLYEVLSLPRDASKADIKKRFFELAKKLHPDVNKDDPKATDKFNEIREAYELLSDDEKRRMYDQFGHAGVDPNASTGPDFDGFSFGGPFNFGGFTAGNFSARGGLSAEDVMEAFEEMLGGRRDVQTAVTLSFLEAVNGTSKTVKVEYSVRDRSGRRQRKQKSVKVVIPPGVDDGMILVLAGQGAESANGSAGDLQVQVKVQKDPYFRRERNDVFVDVSISVAQAILGTTIEVLTLDGMVNLKIPPSTSPGAKLMLKEHGVRDPRSAIKGNQYVQINLEIPRNLTERQIELMKEFEEEEKKKSPVSSSFAKRLQDAWARLRESLNKKN